MNDSNQILLLVDDFAPDREVYRRCLIANSSCAYCLLEADSAMAGLELCRTHAIDAILLDYSLPDKNGIEFLQALHEQCDGDSPPVVMITGQGDERIAVQAIKLGAEDYLVKRDLTPDLLQLAVRSAIGNAQLRLQLRQSDDRFRVSIENMLDCFGIYSAIRDASGQIIDFRFDYLNAAALASNEMTRADMSKTLCEVFPAHHETGLFADYCRVVETGEPLVKENLIYSDMFGAQHLTRAYDVRANKLGDGFVVSWRDVTARKQAEVALHQANQQLTTIWESMTDAYIALDRDWRVIYANSAATQVYFQLTGLEPQEFLGKSHWEIFPSLVGQEVEQAYQRAVTEQVAAHLEVWYEPTGNWFEAHAYPSTEGLGIYFRNISDRKHAEETVQQQLAEIEAIYKTAPVGLCFIDTELRFVRINQQLAEINGLPVAEHLGRTLREVLPEMADQLEPLYGQVIASGEPILNLEVAGTNRAQPGVLRHWCVCYYPQKDMHQRVVGVNVMVQEITDRKQAELERQRLINQLQESERRFREIFNTAFQFVGLLSPDGILLEANQTALDFADLAREAAVGRPFWEVRWWTISPETQQQLQDAIARAAQGEFIRYEVEVLGAGETTTFIDFSLKPVHDESGQVVLLIPEGRDITQRKQLEVEREQAKVERDRLFDLSTDLLMIGTLNGSFLQVNPAWTNTLGWSQEELTTRNYIEFVHPDDVAATRKEAENLSQGGAVINFENRYRCRDGSYRWLSWNVAVEKDDLMYGVARDVSDRKQNEQRLQESEEQLQLGVQVAGVALARFDYASNTVTLSPEAAALYGIPLDELTITRDRMHATFHPDEREEMARIIQQITATDGDGWFARDHRVVWPTGEVRWLSVRKQVFFDRSGAVPRPDYAVLAAIDITDRKRTEAALRDEEQRFKAIIDHSRAAIFMKDMQGRYLLMNRECERLFHITNDWVYGKTDYDLFPSEIADALRANERQVIEAGEAVRLEEEVPLEDGVHTYVAVKFPLLDSEGKPYAICGISTDISDRVRLQAERDRLLVETEAARAEAEAANRSKDEFVAMVAHELRSPLNSIAGWAKLLQTRKFDEAILLKALDTIWRNTQVQVQLVEDLLDISRMVRGTLQITLAPVNVVDVIEAALDIVRPVADAKPIQLETHLSLTPQISGDFNRLQQIVVNLLTNAIKFTPAGGRVDVQLEQGDTQILLRVQDTGKGIAPELLPQIFERFKQGQQNTESKDGLGLGLAIVKNLVELHGGTVTADSAGVGQGSTFTVCLPRLEIPAIGQQPLTIDPASLAGIRVLAVDDEPDMLDLIRFVLQEVGAEVQAVTSARAALECLSQFKPDILLSDVAMPGKSGYELVQQMKSYPEGQIPAIALTSYASATYEERSLQAGFQHHLAKPVEPGDLVAAILSLVRGEIA